MDILLNKNSVWIIARIVIIGLILISPWAVYNKLEQRKVTEYRNELKTLDAEGVLREYFEKKNEKDILRLNETVTDKYRTNYAEQKNLEELKILKIELSDAGTKLFAECLSEEGIEFIDAKTFDVTYYVKYKNDKMQNSGEHTWRYNLIKINDETPWIIENYGFW